MSLPSFIFNITLVIPLVASSKLRGRNTSIGQPSPDKSEYSPPRHYRHTMATTGDPLPIVLSAFLFLNPNLMKFATATDAPSPSIVLLSHTTVHQTSRTSSFHDMLNRGVRLPPQSPISLPLNNKSTPRATDLPPSNSQLEVSHLFFLTCRRARQNFQNI